MSDRKFSWLSAAKISTLALNLMSLLFSISH